jgi:deoxyribodipyrimidine photo-lyase
MCRTSQVQLASPSVPAQLMWFRRDLRLHDHPALSAAATSGEVVAVFVIDPALWDVAGAPRQARLAASLRALDQSLGGRLVVRTGTPEVVLPQLVRATGAGTVHVTADAGPYGRARDARVARALSEDGARLAATGTPYAVGPGTVLNRAGRPYGVFSAFARAWREHGWPSPASSPRDGRVERISWAALPDGLGEALPHLPADEPGHPASAGAAQRSRPEREPAAGETAALERWRAFRDGGGLAGYASARDRPDLDGTSSLSAALKFGEIHPRTLLADLFATGSGAPASSPSADPGAAGTARGAAAFQSELAWREFYADVLWHRPESAREYLRQEFAGLRYDAPGERLDAWREGRTGFPFVDAGMRQLLDEGWMHNRLRMVVASFLVKDLHIEWQHGARWFMRRLQDGDLASNSHGWQWTAGCGTDAAPYFRVFNPVTQGLRFDPEGRYVRRYVPELAHLTGAAAHEPWKHPEGLARGYPERIVDHAAERSEALARYAQRHPAG